MRKTTIAAIGAAILLTTALCLSKPQDDLDSLKVCAATQRLILENALVRVIDDRIPVGVAEPLHRHRHGVVVYLTDYTVEQTSQDGHKATSRRSAGTASWSEAVTHEVRNVGQTPSHAIRIELKP